MLKVLALLSWFVASPIFAQGYEAKYDVVWNMGIRLEAEAVSYTHLTLPTNSRV